MEQQKKKEISANPFVASMLESAQKNEEVKPQTRFDHVDEKQLGAVMARLQKGQVKR